MPFNKIKSHILVTICGIALLAVLILLILQWGNTSAFSFFGKSYGTSAPGGVNTGLIMLACLVGGPILLWLGKILFSHSMQIYRHRSAAEKAARQQAKITDDVIHEVHKAQQSDEGT